MTRVPAGFFAAAALSIVLPAGAVFGAASWEPIGPYGYDGGQVLSTSDPDVLYTTTQSGLFRSADQGERWRKVNPTRFAALAVDPRDPNALLATLADDYYEVPVRSTDGGRTFRPAGQGLLWGLPEDGAIPHTNGFVYHPRQPDVVFALTEFGLFQGLEEQPWRLIAFAGADVSAFAIDPETPARWFARTLHSGAGYQPPFVPDVKVSEDAGATWTSTVGEIDRRGVGQLLFDPVRPHRLYAVSFCRPSVYEADRWRALPLPEGVFTCRITMSSVGVIFAAFFDVAGRQGLLRSDDGGETWRRSPQPNDRFIHTIATIPTAPDVVIVAAERGLWRSPDGGASWSPSSGGISGFSGTLGVAPDGGLFLSAGREGVFVSSDDGSTWRRRARGLQHDALAAVAVDPRHAEVVWVGGQELHRTRDGGRSWQGVSLPRHPRRVGIYQIVVDPVREGFVYVLTYAHTAAGLLAYRTTDDGQSWEPLPRVDRSSFLLAAALSDGTLYAYGAGGSRGARLLTSRDGGATWKVVRGSLPFVMTSLAIDPHRSHILWAGAYGGGVWRSVDGGRTFEALVAGTPLGYAEVTPLVFDPDDPDHPYAGDGTAVFRWTGSQQGWQRVGALDAWGRSPVAAPAAFDATRRILYAHGSPRGFYRLRLR